jgi:hypothetical protein
MTQVLLLLLLFLLLFFLGSGSKTRSLAQNMYFAIMHLGAVVIGDGVAAVVVIPVAQALQQSVHLSA